MVTTHTQDGPTATGHQGWPGGRKLWTQVLEGCYSANPPGWEDDSAVCHAFLLVWATGFLLEGEYRRAGPQVGHKMKQAAGQTQPCLAGLFPTPCWEFQSLTPLHESESENRLFW